MKKILKYLSWIPFAISIGSLILYLRYFVMFKLDSNLVMTDAVKETLNNYLILVFVSLFVGLLIILFKKIFNLINTEDKDEIKEVVKNHVSNNETLNNVNNQEFINAIENSSRTISNIDMESNFVKYVKSNKVIRVKLSEPIISQSVKGKIVDTDEDIEILLLDEDIEYLNNKNDVIDPAKCPKCNNIVNKDAFICTNCGILLNKYALNDILLDFNNKKHDDKNDYIDRSNDVDRNNNIEEIPKKFNFVIFAVNFLIIILCIFLIFLVGNKIVNQRNKNYSNMNVAVENK